MSQEEEIAFWNFNALDINKNKVGQIHLHFDSNNTVVKFTDKPLRPRFFFFKAPLTAFSKSKFFVHRFLCQMTNYKTH